MSWSQFRLFSATKLNPIVITRFSSLLLAGFTYIWVAFHIGLDANTGGPDEMMRSLIPSCIIQGNVLPSGYDTCAIYSIGNWSYAFYPQVLGSYVSAGFMSIFKLLGSQGNLIYISGRFSSVFFSLITLYALSKTAEYAFGKRHDKWLIQLTPIALVGFWPQYIFISSYMNNESVALAGISIMTMALVKGVKDNWTVKDSIVLAIGIIITGLGYFNAYGFILASIVIFSVTLFRQTNINRHNKFNLFLLTAGISVLVILPFFIINWVRYGDPIGTSIFKERQALWVAENGTTFQHPWNRGLRELLFHSDFPERTVSSFVGTFGYMAQPLPFIIEFIYLSVALIGLGTSLKTIIRKFENERFRILALNILLASIITVALFLYYNLRTDYQPQGRYIIYLLIPIALSITIGAANILHGQKYIVRSLILSIEIAYMIFGVFLMMHLANNYNWIGVTSWPH